MATKDSRQLVKFHGEKLKDLILGFEGVTSDRGFAALCDISSTSINDYIHEKSGCREERCKKMIKVLGQEELKTAVKEESLEIYNKIISQLHLGTSSTQEDTLATDLDILYKHSQILTSDFQVIHPQRINITINLDYAAITEEGQKKIEEIAPSWEPSVEWPGPAPKEVSNSFKARNKERKKDEGKPLEIKQETPGVLTRLTANPLANGRLDLQLAPFSFELYATPMSYPPFPDHLAKGHYVPSEVLHQAIEQFRELFEDKHPVDKEVIAPMVSPKNFRPLGLEVLVMTSDERVLIRKKDPTTTASPGLFDGSFSGYARFRSDRDWNYVFETESPNKFGVDIRKWAQKEFKREIGIEPDSVEEFLIFGVHRNTETGANDILGLLKVNQSAEDLAGSICIDKRLGDEETIHRSDGEPWTEEDRKRREQELVDAFKTNWRLDDSKGVYEIEAENAANYFVKFTSDGLKEFFNDRAKEKSDPNEYPYLDIIPETMHTILCSLREVHNESAYQEVIRSLPLLT